MKATDDAHLVYDHRRGLHGGPRRRERKGVGMRGKTVLGLALAFAVGVLVPAGAAAPQAGQDITGVWTVTMELAETKAQVEATVKQVGEKIQVSLTTPSGTFELAGTMINNELSVTHQVKIQEVTGEVKMTGTLADDRFAGTIDFLGQGQIKWTAVRKKAEAAPAPAPATEAPAAK